MYKIIIPTFKRHKTLKEKTLAYLMRTNVEVKNIYIYVASEEEKNIYQNYLDKNTYNKIIVGKRGIPQQRNFIQKTHPIGTKLFMIDDDIKKLSEKISDKKIIELTNLDGFIRNAFNICAINKVRYFGTYPVDNPFFMKKNVSFDLKYIVGNVIGIINNHEILRDEGKECKARANFTAGKESHEMTVKYFIADGGIGRFNFIAPTTEYWKGEGGHQVSRNAQGEKEATEWLLQKYPRYFKKVLRKNGMWDLTFRKLKKGQNG